QSGATMVMGIFMAAMTVGVLYYLQGVIGAIAYRERLNDAADAATFAAAVIYARAMNFIVLLNLFMAVLAITSATVWVAHDIVLSAAIFAGAVCPGCPFGCGFCCYGCRMAPIHARDASRLNNRARQVEQQVDNVIRIAHTIARAMKVGAPSIALGYVIRYGVEYYAPTTSGGAMFPKPMPFEDDDTNYPCDTKVRPTARDAGRVLSLISTTPSVFMIPGLLLANVFATQRARRFCGSYNSFQKVEDDAWLGEQPFQLQAFMMGNGSPQSRYRRVSRQGLKVASWGREVSYGLQDTLDPLSRVSFAQAEYYFEDQEGKPKREWLWHPHWRARMRRFRLEDTLPGLGFAAGALGWISNLIAH
ncbi:MAG: hypothetical protein RML93_11580, partial [Anaerolineales bacterium]|nr:hypothetical protein [Anaerolineales bacterium]MDW8447915.1 hypothetical protein [Anaerolineales bacterium]